MVVYYRFLMKTFLPGQQHLTGTKESKNDLQLFQLLKIIIKKASTYPLTLPQIVPPWNQSSIFRTTSKRANMNKLFQSLWRKTNIQKDNIAPTAASQILREGR